MYHEIIQNLKPGLAQIQDRINQAVCAADIQQEFRDLLLEITGNPGKMLRPVLMLIAAGDCDKEQEQEILASAAGLELIHTSSLILDDIIDRADERRGEPTVVHKHGISTAICSGDFLLVSAFRYLVECGYTESARELMLVAQTACDGEIMQHGNLHNTLVTESSYMKTIEKKTAYVFESACRTACRVAGRDGKTCAAMETVGRIIGTLFQMRDDLLDWTAEAQDVGKPVNEDFREGIYTLPAIYTFRDPQYGKELRALAEKRSLSDDDCRQARRIVEKAGGIEATKRKIRELGAQARGSLKLFPSDSDTDTLARLISLLEVS